MSQVSSKSGFSSEDVASIPSIYDVYLCKEPASDLPLLSHNGPDDYTAKMRTLQRSADYFAEKDQIRAVERLQLEMARVHMQQDQWERAARVLTPLWQTLSWRRSGWWNLLNEVDWALRDCASRIRDLETLIAVEWELMGSSLTPRQDWNQNFFEVLKPLKPIELRPTSVIRAESILSCVSATFAFRHSEGNVGEDLHSQLVIYSHAHVSSTPLVVSQIVVSFEGGFEGLTIQNDADTALPSSVQSDPVQVVQVPLHQSRRTASMSSGPSPLSNRAPESMGRANLILQPGFTKALTLTHIPRDACEIEVERITICLQAPDFAMELIFTDDNQLRRETFFVPGDPGPIQKRLKNGRSNAVRILPKPPKIQMKTNELASTYFTNETFDIALRIINEEEDDADVSIDARLQGPPGTIPQMRWIQDGDSDEARKDNTMPKSSDHKEESTRSKSVGRMTSASEQSHNLRIETASEASDYVLEARARYHLISDPETTITKSFSANIKVALPFEVSYSFVPMIHTEPWPSYFSANTLGLGNEDQGTASANGLYQTWSLTSRIYSSADVALKIKHVEPRVLEAHEDTMCKITPCAGGAIDPVSIKPDEIKEYTFTLETQKTDLEDRRPAYLDLRLDVEWCREGTHDSSATTHLAVPELVIPFGEPRVLASARNGGSPSSVIYLDYVIENPSIYTLTFNVTMETSEEFSFGGVKNISMQLVPLSRHTIQYSLMPLSNGVWISPQFKVFDTHFHKLLKIQATEGIRSDKKGISIWVDAEG